MSGVPAVDHARAVLRERRASLSKLEDCYLRRMNAALADQRQAVKEAEATVARLEGRGT